MEVFYGSTMVVKVPLVHAGRANLDFGKGFYVTSLRTQAMSWACRPANAGKQRWLNVYDLDVDSLKQCCKVKIFPAYDEEWLDFVMECRQGGNVWQAYDAVRGGIADDRIFNTIELYTAGIISKEETLSRLVYEKPNNQICIISQEVADRYLRFISSEELL